MNTISTDTGLDAFRVDCSGEYILQLLQQHGGRMLVNWPVGVGKSHNIDDVIEAVITDDAYDLVIVLCPTKQIIAERRFVREPPVGVQVVILRSRPSNRCGPQRNQDWRHYETAGMGFLGRKKICSACPHLKTCFWPTQYGKGLRGSMVIFATQAHLERDPFFISQLSRWTGAKRILVILDEDKAMLSCFRRRIRNTDLLMFKAAVDKVQRDGHKPGKWPEMCDMLLAIRQSDDMRDRNWKISNMPAGLAVRVQEAGYALCREQFRFIGYNVQQLFCSHLESRELHVNGDITFASPPRIGTDLLIYSGTTIPEFCEFRLGIKLANPFEDYRFIHPGTRWFNIANRMGAKRYVPKNADQILGFFAGLVAQRLTAGKRVLLVSKKCFISLCTEEMTRRLKALGFPKIRIITKNWDRCDLNDPHIIPLINYGLVGTNLFEQFDCAYCLNSYYVNEQIVNNVVQDVLASDGYIPLKIQTRGIPLRRSVTVVDHAHQLCDVQQLAKFALRQQEIDVVVQTVGRVRPFTRPREIITFQAAEHPSIKYEREFDVLDQARKFFNIRGARDLQRETTTSKVQKCKVQGKTQTQTSTAQKLSLSTVKRHWHAGVMTP
jgi:hypothetical protein